MIGAGLWSGCPMIRAVRDQEYVVTLPLVVIRPIELP
jgi:hypothetical protein